VLVLVSENALFWNGDPGFTPQPAGRPFVVEVGWVTPNGPAWRAGLRPRDRIDLRNVPFAERVFLSAIAAPLAGHPLPVTVERNGRTRQLEVVPRPKPMRWDGWVGNIVLLWIAAFGGFIGWRRPEMPEARLLSIALSCYVVADVLQYFTTPSPALDVLFSALNMGGVLGAVSCALLVRFTELFGRPISPVRRVVNSLAYAATGLLALYGIISAAALATLRIDPVPLYFGLWGVAIICGAQVMVIVAGAFAVAGSRGFERQRLTWAVASIGTLLAAGVGQILLNVAIPTAEMQFATQITVNLIAVIAPVGLTYSLLNQRLLDVGFALNRAAVFSAVSAIVVGAFIAIEWALGGWLANVRHVTSTIVGVAIAIALGFSIKLIHKRVDHAVDSLFFHKRHEQEKALLRFAHEAAFISDAQVLLARTVDEVAQHSEASSVAIMTRTARGTYICLHFSDTPPGDVDENDPAIVAMRATLQSVDLNRRPTALRGEYAFPMISRGVLLGILVCGAKNRGDAYAPDECEALAKLAHGVGTALDAAASDHGDVEAAILGLQDEFTALRAELRELIDVLRPPSEPKRARH
jgi:hypothetical protein